jgi:hypothetical protein
MNSVRPRAGRFYRVKSGHMPVGTELNESRHQNDDIWWWIGSTGRMASHRQEYLLHHSSRWKDQENVLWKVVGKLTGWKAGRCRHMQVPERLPTELCVLVVIHFLEAADIGKF